MKKFKEFLKDERSGLQTENKRKIVIVLFAIIAISSLLKILI